MTRFLPVLSHSWYYKTAPAFHNILQRVQVYSHNEYLAQAIFAVHQIETESPHYTGTWTLRTFQPKSKPSSKWAGGLRLATPRAARVRSATRPPDLMLGSFFGDKSMKKQAHGLNPQRRAQKTFMFILLGFRK